MADSCRNRYGQTVRCNSRWNSWGRWVALVVIVLAFLVFFILCSCVNARRRRKRGRQPMYGTGWTGRLPYGHGQAQYNPNYNTQQPQQEQYNQGAPPQYNPQPGYGANQSYFGGQRNDVEMQPPANSYGGNHVYNAPPGPPPGKVA